MGVNGQIQFHIIDAVTKRPVWEANYSETLRDPDKALTNIDKEVNGS